MEGKGGVIPLPTWQPLPGDVFTCAKLHRIPCRWISPGVPQALLTKPQNMGPQRMYFGESMEGMIPSFFSRKERHGALANAKSLALKFRGNDIGAFLRLLCERFSAVSQTKFFEFFFEISESFKNKSMILKKYPGISYTFCNTCSEIKKNNSKKYNSNIT